MTNRCPKCDNDRFKTDKKGHLDIAVVDGQKCVQCSWCNYPLPMVLPEDPKDEKSDGPKDPVA